MNFNLPVAVAAIMVSLTCLTLSTVSGKEATEMDINDLLARLDAMADDIRDARQETERARLETKEVKSILKATTERLEQDNVIMKQQMDDLMADTKHEDDPVQVAFSVASYVNCGPVSEDTNIPYQTTYINIGGGWDSVINVFRVPISCSGVYMFTASMTSNADSNESSRGHIVHTTSVGQTKKVSMWGHSTSTGDANTVIMEVKEGDYVSVQLEGGRDGYIHSSSVNTYSTFSGFLLFRQV